MGLILSRVSDSHMHAKILWHQVCHQGRTLREDTLREHRVSLGVLNREATACTPLSNQGQEGRKASCVDLGTL